VAPERTLRHMLSRAAGGLPVMQRKVGHRRALKHGQRVSTAGKCQWWAHRNSARARVGVQMGMITPRRVPWGQLRLPAAA